jgi:hypothetical protein
LDFDLSTNLPADRQRLLVGTNGLVVLTQAAICLAQVVARIAFFFRQL